MSRLLPFDWTRRGGAPRPSLWWSRSALVPRFSRSTPTTARVGPTCARGGGSSPAWSHSTPPAPRATTLNELCFLVCLSYARVQTSFSSETGRVLALWRPARQRGARTQLLRPQWLR